MSVSSVDISGDSLSCLFSSSTGVFAVIGCIVILYFNIGVPNELRGFFFYAQVSYVTMATVLACDVDDDTMALALYLYSVYNQYVTTM